VTQYSDTGWCGWVSLHSVPQAVIWSCVYVDVQEGKVTIRLSLHGELDVEMVKEIIRFLGSMGPDRECIIHVAEPTSGLEGRLAESHLLGTLHKEVCNDK